MKQENILTPTQVNQYIKGLMDRDRLLTGLLVQGELSNYKIYPSGHHYFSLKDREGTLRGVMFRGDAASLRFRPENGMQVIAGGRISVFPRDGQYQLYCARMMPAGAGDLHVAFEQLKQRLFQEGLFQQEHKKPIPSYPEKIALVTSPAGAAVRDMLRILGARFPLAQVYILPVRVQGEGAAEEIAAALAWANHNRVADLLITGRGGGSMEDLWAFNEEVVARAIYASQIPVISAVGHEPDVTISDFVADLRAATPSNAAELAVPDQTELYGALHALAVRLAHGIGGTLQRHQRQLDRLGQTRCMASPLNYLQDKRVLLDYQSHRLSHAAEGGLSRRREQFIGLSAALDAMSPLKVLGRGYSVARQSNGAVLTLIRDISVGDSLTLRLLDGSLDCRVENTHREDL